jgi:hypothetical protein
VHRQVELLGQQRMRSKLSSLTVYGACGAKLKVTSGSRR